MNWRIKHYAKYFSISILIGIVFAFIVFFSTVLFGLYGVIISFVMFVVTVIIFAVFFGIATHKKIIENEKEGAQGSREEPDEPDPLDENEP